MCPSLPDYLKSDRWRNILIKDHNHDTDPVTGEITKTAGDKYDEYVSGQEERNDFGKEDCLVVIRHIVGIPIAIVKELRGIGSCCSRVSKTRRQRRRESSREEASSSYTSPTSTTSSCSRRQGLLLLAASKDLLRGPALQPRLLATVFRGHR